MSRKTADSECPGTSRGCMYCDMPLSPRHEHDHFPIPFSAGGTQLVCACINCHDLKDRVRFVDVPELFAAQQSLWQRMTPLERIWLARLFALTATELAQEPAA